MPALSHATSEYVMNREIKGEYVLSHTGMNGNQTLKVRH